jgi:hypothetical protein
LTINTIYHLQRSFLEEEALLAIALRTPPLRSGIETVSTKRSKPFARRYHLRSCLEVLRRTVSTVIPVVPRVHACPKLPKQS